MSYPKEIVGAMIGTTITNDRERIAGSLKQVTEWLDRPRMELMAAFDLGPKWTAMASGPTLFCIGEDGQPLPADARKLAQKGAA